MDGAPAPKGQSSLSSTQLGWFLDLGPQRLTQLVQAGIVIRIGHDRYDPSSVRRYVQWQRASGTNGASAWNAARTALATERARIARLNRKEREGALLPADEVSEAGAAVAICLRDKLLTLPSKLAARVVTLTPAKAERLLREQIRECLEELSRLSVISDSPRRRRRADALP
jgi:hypothetical protein